MATSSPMAAARRSLPFWSASSLIAANAFTIYLAYDEGWDIHTLRWIYWFQSVTIGVFNFIRLLSLKEFSTDNFRMNNQPVEPTDSTKYVVSIFFLVHYGFSHMIYAVLPVEHHTSIQA